MEKGSDFTKSFPRISFCETKVDVPLILKQQTPLARLTEACEYLDFILDFQGNCFSNGILVTCTIVGKIVNENETFSFRQLMCKVKFFDSSSKDEAINIMADLALEDLGLLPCVFQDSSEEEVLSSLEENLHTCLNLSVQRLNESEKRMVAPLLNSLNLANFN